MIVNLPENTCKKIIFLLSRADAEVCPYDIQRGVFSYGITSTQKKEQGKQAFLSMPYTLDVSVGDAHWGMHYSYSLYHKRPP